MRINEALFTPADEDLDYFCDGVSGAGPFTQLATTTPDLLAHKLSLQEKSSVSQAGKTFTFVGTDADGKAITETITGPGSTLTVETTKYFKTLSSVTPSATLGANTVDVGIVDEIASKTVEVDSGSTGQHGAQVDISGTINYTVQETMDNVLKKGATVQWMSTISALASKTADALGNATRGAAGLRFITTSYSSGATARVVIRPCQG